MPDSSRSRPRRALVAVLGAVLPLLVLPGVARADDAPAAGRTVTGELVQAWPEYLDHDQAAERGADTPLSWIRTAGDDVRVDTAGLGDVATGSTVRVVVGGTVADDASAQGVEPARAVLAAQVVAPPAADQGTTAPASAPTNEVTVVRVAPPGAADDGTPVGDIVDTVNDEVAGFWSEQTDGAIRLHATAYPDWVTTTNPCSSATALWNEVAGDVGFTPGPGKHLLLYIPSGFALSGCSDGLAQIGDGPSTGGFLYVRYVMPSIITHELGHNFSLRHSTALQCRPYLEGDNCQIDTYGDWYDVMGISWWEMGTLSPVQADQLGVLPASAVRTYAVGTSSTTSFSLAPAGGRTGVRAVEISVPGEEPYWLEYRSPVGQDDWLADDDQNTEHLQSGVLLRRASSDPLYGSYLLDGTPGSSAYDTSMQTALPLGREVRIGSGRSLPIRVTAVDANGATIRIGALSGAFDGDSDCAALARTPESGISLSARGAAVYAFGTGTDRQVWYRQVDRNTPGWASLGGVSLYGPAAVTAGSTSYVFTIGGDHQLWMRADSGSGWGAWTPLGGYLTGSPAAASLGEGHVRVFGRGADDELWTREFSGGRWGPWTYLSGILTSPPTATAYPSYGQVEVSVRGADGLVYTMGLGRGDGFRGYLQRSFSGCSTLAVPSVSTSAFYKGRVYLDSAGSLWMGSGNSATPTSYGGHFVSNPDVEAVGSSTVIAGTGGDRQLWVYDTRPGGLGGWISFGGQFL